MNKHYKIYTLFAILLIILFSFKLMYEYKKTEEIKELSIQYESESIANFLIAFRGTYQDIFIKNHTKLNASNIDFLPVRTTNEIAKRFSQLNTQSKIATVSDRPRNPNNMANKRQLEAIEYFLKDKSRKSLFKNIGDKHYYSQPLYINEVCLNCHGQKEDAPTVIKNNYDSAYGYKLGELRGIIDIEVSQTRLSTLLDSNNKNKKFFVFLLLAFILTVTFLYARYNKLLTDKVTDASIALEEMNHALEDKVQDEIAKNRVKDQQLFQQSRLAQMGEMLSMIAHQWRQPLGSISSTVMNIELKMQMGKYDLTTTKGREEHEVFLGSKLENINLYVQSLSTTIDDFRNFYNPNKERSDVSINKPIMQALEIIKSSLLAQGIMIEQNYESEKILTLADGELMQVFLNLFKNSQDNFKEKNISDASISITTSDSEKGVLVEICDNGGGIPDDIMIHIFDPYFSTKNEKNGTGLGLYMSKTIVEEHHQGKLSAINKDAGVCFTIYIEGEGR